MRNSWPCIKCKQRQSIYTCTECEVCAGFPEGSTPSANEMDGSRKIRNQLKWISELETKIASCTDDGWFPWTPQACREFFLAMWPEYTPRKEYEATIGELQAEMHIPLTYPRHRNLCPMKSERSEVIPNASKNSSSRGPDARQRLGP